MQKLQLMSTGLVWRFVEPFETHFAQAGLRSPAQIIGPTCPRCARGDQYIKPKPLVFEWEPGSEIVGDFIWPSGGRVAVKKTVYESLASRFRGIHASDLGMVQDPRLKPPKKRTIRSKPRVWLPYTGPDLVELWPERIVSFLPTTTIIVQHKCEMCGRESLRISGPEVKAHIYDRDKNDLVPDLQPRVPGKGVVIASSEVKDSPIFRLDKFSEAIFCTDEVKSFIERERFTNIDFLEYGDVV